MSEVEGPAELGLLPNQLKRTQPASADSIYTKEMFAKAQYGNLTGPTSICWDSSGVGMQNSLLASVTEEGFRPEHLCVPLCISVLHHVVGGFWYAEMLHTELFPVTSF